MNTSPLGFSQIKPYIKRLCGRVVKAVDSSSTIVKMHEFEPRRSQYIFFVFFSF